MSIRVEALLPDQLVPFYLMSCFLYYERDDPVLTDAEFDALSARLRAEWRHVKHQHKHFLRFEDIGTGFRLKGRIPNRVIQAALTWKEARKVGALRVSSTKRKITVPG